MNTQRAQVEVSIDGEDVLSGKSLIVEPNSEIELERFVENLSKGNRFRFIQKTQKIIEHRGDKIDDGFIRVVVRFEKVVKTVHWKLIRQHFPPITHPGVYFSRGSLDDATLKGDTSEINCFQSVNAGETLERSVIPKEDEGITVKGSESQQQFRVGWIGQLEDVSHVIILRLRGTKGDGMWIETPVTVKTKLQCPTCGTKSKSSAKFCRECR